jgi:D-alanyl-D-alanine carboxypeptidase (penicillin-binding protein 5/6)
MHFRFAHILAIPLTGVAMLPLAGYLWPAAPVPMRISLPSSITVSPAPLRWPAEGEGALGTGQYGISATPRARPLPTASVAKVMTALVVLEKKPLRLGESGPVITVTAEDVAAYERDQTQDQSVVPVVAGEELTEYQALQALLLPSANNVAELLARWAFGTLQNGVARLNSRAAELHLTQTSFADASGFDPRTVSVPTELVTLGLVAMQNPVLAEIVRQSQAVLPVAGQVTNVNTLLGQAGIIGIKTGNTIEAGGCYLFAASFDPGNGRPVVLVGALMGMPDLSAAMAAAPGLLDDARASLRVRHLLQRGEVIGSLLPPGGKAVDLVTTQPLDLVVWGGTRIELGITLRQVAPPLASGQVVGSVDSATGGREYSVSLITTGPLSSGRPLGW